MRTTLDLPDEMWEAVKEKAYQDRTSARMVVVEALGVALKKETKTLTARVVKESVVEDWDTPPKVETVKATYVEDSWSRRPATPAPKTTPKKR